MVNQATLDLLGYKEGELLGKSLATVFEQEEFFSNKFGFAEIIRKGGIKGKRFVYRSKGGTGITVSLSAGVMYEPDGQLVGIVMVGRDIREAEEMERRQHALLLEKAKMEKEREVASEQAKFLELLTKEREELKKRTGELEEAERASLNIMEDLDLRRKESELREIELRKTHIQLVQAEKMSSLGQLAGGVAHELNSPLAGILELLRAMIRKAPNKGDAKFLTVMRDAAEHAATIVKDLRAFARPARGEPEPVSVNELMDKTLSFGVHDFRLKGITLVKKYLPDIRPVMADASQLQQVFLNMLTNARDALDGKKDGKKELVIETQNLANGVAVSFADTGCGMPDEVIQKIFDPFFSTKGVGEGTGLGLSISHGIIESCGGEIRVTSKEGEGTTFTILLPPHH